MTVFFFVSLDAECAELIFCHGAIILVTQYETGLAQRGLSGLVFLFGVTRGNVGSSCDCFD